MVETGGNRWIVMELVDVVEAIPYLFHRLFKIFHLAVFWDAIYHSPALSSIQSPRANRWRSLSV